MQRHHLNLTAVLLVTAMTAIPALAQGVNNNWEDDGSGVNPDQYQGRWEDVAHWSAGVVPGVAGSTDDHNARWMSAWGNNGPAITTLDNDSLTALGVDSINLRSIDSQHINQSSGLVRRGRLIVNGTALNPITLNVGSLTDAPNRAISSSIRLGLELSWTNLNIIGTPTGDGIWLYRQGADLAGAPMHVFTDTNVTMTAAAADRGLAVGHTGDQAEQGARLEMTRGSLTITNATNNARILVAGTTDPDESLPGGLTLNDTLLTTNNVFVQTLGTFRINNSGLAATSTISGTYNVAGGGVGILEGGSFEIGNVVFNTPLLDQGSSFTVTGGDLAINNNLTMNFGGSGPATYGPLLFHVDGGDVTVGNNIRIGALNRGDDTYQILLSDGSLTVGNSLILGHKEGQSSTGRRGAGMLNMTGGTLQADTLEVGSNHIRRGDGFYNQTGGVATFGDIVLMTLAVDGSFTAGTRQFVVGSGATLNVIGSGFAMPSTNNAGNTSHTTDWSSSLLTAANLNFGGTLKFSPDGVNEQNLIVFGSDIGADTAGYDADFAIGTLDVSDLAAAGALLNVLAAGNETTNAVYVRSLLLGDAGQLDPGSFFAGNVNVYYDSTQSDITGTHAFTGGGTGSLIALPIPEPASALLLAGGALVMLRRRKSAV